MMTNNELRRTQRAQRNPMRLTRFSSASTAFSAVKKIAKGGSDVHNA